MERCDVCERLTLSAMHVGVGCDDEMALCPECAELAFPGLADMMRHECPICAAEAASMN
jgi:hypothetical protein